MFKLSSKITKSFSTAVPRRFQILGLQQKVGDFKSERENVDEDILRLGEGDRLGPTTSHLTGPHAIEIDLMTPLDANKKPAVHIPPLNHIGLWVDDLKVAVENLQEMGVRLAPGGIRKGAAGYDVAFLHPKGNDEFPISGEGVLIELVQAPPDVIKALKK